jgi:hypothetical protein
MREYRKTKARMNAKTQFRKGAEAMRQKIVEEMGKIGLEHFNGYSAAEFARRVELG